MSEMLRDRGVALRSLTERFGRLPDFLARKANARSSPGG
jgi:hypothetical protein